MPEKLEWAGRVLSIQPRIRLLRSFDQRSHSYLGYVLTLQGSIGGQERAFSVAIGEKAQEKHQFRAGDTVQGHCVPVGDVDLEVAEYYKASGLKIVSPATSDDAPTPPWLGVPPDLPTYRARGHRRLDPAVYAETCPSCIWGAKMSVQMIIDQWNPTNVRYRVETFCYGPKMCPTYRPGPKRRVPGRKGMVWVEEDWVGEEATAHRSATD